ncbi:MAG TPA: hypothetical protein VK754_02690 [Propionibacteriaceae bacterium]|nr:hypothetical protein [Propionibacteriaceae bacterium]
MNLQVPVQRLPARAAGSLALGVEAFGQVGDLLLQALRDGCQVLLIPSNQRRVGLGDKVLGKVERSCGQGDHVIISDIDMRSRVVVSEEASAGATYGSARQTTGCLDARGVAAAIDGSRTLHPTSGTFLGFE